MIEDLPGEVWRSVENFDGHYEVSTAGRIKSLARTLEIVAAGRRPYTITIKERLLRPSLSRRRPNVTLWREHEATVAHVAQLVAKHFIGPAPDGLSVMLIDGNPANVALSNLRYATRQEIETGKSDRGTTRRGETISWHTLSPEDVRWIRANPEGLSQRALAEQFAVSQSQVGRIVRGEDWRSIPREREG